MPRTIVIQLSVGDASFMAGRGLLADGALGVHAEEDGDEDGEAPEGAASVAEEGQGNADDGQEADDHADVDDEMKGEDAHDGVAVGASEAPQPLPLGQYQQPQDECPEEQQHAYGAKEALLFADGAEDEVGLLFGHVAEFRLGAVEEALTPQPARADGNLRLMDVVAHVLDVLLHAQHHADALLLVVLEHVVEDVVGGVVVAHGAHGKQGDEEVHGAARRQVAQQEPDGDEAAEPNLHPADVERDEVARGQQGDDGDRHRNGDDDEGTAAVVGIDAQHDGGDNGDERHDDEKTYVGGDVGKEMSALADAHHEEDDGAEPDEQERARHSLAVEDEEESEENKG